jgi:hypothetical protein
MNNIPRLGYEWSERFDALMDYAYETEPKLPFRTHADHSGPQGLIEHITCSLCLINFYEDVIVASERRAAAMLDTPHQRLQLAVVEAAKTFRAAETAHWVESEVGNDPARTQRERSQAYLRLTETVDALNRFEAEQKNGNT